MRRIRTVLGRLTSGARLSDCHRPAESWIRTEARRLSPAETHDTELCYIWLPKHLAVDLCTIYSSAIGLVRTTFFVLPAFA